MTGPAASGGQGQGPEDEAGQASVPLMPLLRADLSKDGIDLEQEITRTAMSVVFRGTDRRHARPVAIKLLGPAATAGADSDALLHEIHLAAGLQHPHILPLYQSGMVDGAPFYVMPYVEGESLRHRLARGTMPVDEALRIALEVADALRYAHSHGVVHRDIKPENILLEDGHAVVTDFGVAARLSDSDLTRRGKVVGTPAYMSPEQASGEVVFDGRSDLYALACVLYEMLSHEPPFPGGTPRAVIARRFLGPPIPLRQLRPEIPESVAAVVDRALALDPADRFPSAADFVEALLAASRTRVEGHARSRDRQLAAQVAGVLVVVMLAAVAGHAAHRAAPPGFDSRRVAVAALSNETGDRRLAPLGRMVASWIIDRLAGTADIAVVTSATVVPAQHDQHLAQGGVDDPARLQRLAAETRAGTLISGSYYRGDLGSVEFHVEITDANSGRLLRAIGPVTSGTDPDDAMAARLGRAVAATVDTLLTRDGSGRGRAPP